MIESALQIMLCMWAVSFSVFGFQVVLADVAGTELTNYEGEPIRSHLSDLLRQKEFNQVTENVVTANYQDNTTRYDKVETYPIAAAYVAWELVQLLSGTYIFAFLVLMGEPPIFVTILVVLYFALLARAIVGYIRGV